MRHGLREGWPIRAKRRSLLVSITVARTRQNVIDASITTGGLARHTFWLLPHFTRWAQARALQTRLGGDLSLQQLTVLYLIRTEGATLSAMARRLMVAPTVLTNESMAFTSSRIFEWAKESFVGGGRRME